MKNLLILIILGTWTALLSGCVTVEETYAPDGSKVMVVDCSTTDLKILNWGDCQKKAGEICGERGYEVVSKDSDSNASGTASAAGGGDTVIGTAIWGNKQARTMMIRCRGEEPDEPAEKTKRRKLG